MILAMENAGQLIEDEELRAQIKGSGIGTSATRAEILKKLVANKYIALNKKTQILNPTLMGEMIFDVVNQLCGGRYHYAGGIHDETGTLYPFQNGWSSEFE